MRINSMKLTIILILIGFLAGIMAGLFFRTMPDGNEDVIYMFIGILLGILSHAISGLFKKGE